MERSEAKSRLAEIIGIDLHTLIEPLQVSYEVNGKINKGWAGHVIERYLGLPINSSRDPNFGSWELKTVPLKIGADGKLKFKETMCICQLDPFNVSVTEFEESHLLRKLKKLLLVARVVGPTYEHPTFIHSIVEQDLTESIYQDIKNDYNLVRACLQDPERGFAFLSGRMGTYIQPRTKGKGHGSVSRAFYARKKFLEIFIPLVS